MPISFLAASVFCSLASFHTVRPEAVVIATVLADTVLAGPGPVAFQVAVGHAGGASNRSIYGQLARVERSVASSVPGNEVLLVPWDYGADCRPTPWALSAVWTEPGTRGLFTGTLRPREQWVEGTPTVDVYAAGRQPYPQAFDGRGTTGTGALLTVDAYADLLEVLPTWKEVRESGTAAFQRALAWIVADSARRASTPARGIESYIRYSARHDALESLEVPVAGTYRIVVSGPNLPRRTFFARTMSAPVAEYRQDPTVLVEPGDFSRPIEGYSLLLTGADRLDLLPTERVGMEREGYLNVLLAMEPWSTGVRTARGQFDIDFLIRQFPGDTTLRRLSQQAPLSTDGAIRNRARIILGPGTKVLVVEEVELGDGRRLTIRAERISPETLVN